MTFCVIQPVIGSGDRVRHGPTRIFFLHLRDSVPGIICVIRRGAVVERGFRAAIQRIVRVRRHLKPEGLEIHWVTGTNGV